MLANWTAAFESASVSALVSDVHIAQTDVSMFWLHADANSHEWLKASISEILAGFPNAKTVVLANVPNQAEAALALGLGAVGYCHAYSDAAVLLAVESVVMHGGIWLGQDLLQHLIGVSRQLIAVPSTAVTAALELLTPRERDVAQQASIGLSNKEIARELNITERTVKAHLSASFERLGVKDRLQLALILNGKS